MRYLVMYTCGGRIEEWFWTKSAAIERYHDILRQRKDLTDLKVYEVTPILE